MLQFNLNHTSSGKMIIFLNAIFFINYNDSVSYAVNFHLSIFQLIWFNIF